MAHIWGVAFLAPASVRLGGPEGGLSFPAADQVGGVADHLVGAGADDVLDFGPVAYQGRTRDP